MYKRQDSIDGVHVETDLYYADLQGTWNEDGDDNWGEVPDDNVDGYPDVYVGRLPASTSEEAEDLVEKVISYEDEEFSDADWFTRALLLGTDPFKDYEGAEGEILKDYIEENYIWANFTTTKLYETQGTLSRQAIIDHINQGYGFVNFAGHGWPTYWYLGNGYYYDSDAYSQTNGEKLPLVAAMACLTSRFAGSYECIGEKFLLNPDGGAIAYFGSTRVAWGYASSYVTEGLAGELDWRFFRAFFYHGLREVGRVWAKALQEYIDNHPIDTYYEGYGYLDWKTVAEYGSPFGDPSLRLSGRRPPDTTPPRISGITREPQEPNYNDTVSVSALVTDEESGVAEVWLIYTTSLDGGERRTRMQLSGSVYVGTIPPMPLGTTVQYRVMAVDEAGNKGYSAAYSYTVGDYYTPVVAFVSPTNGSVLTGLVEVVIHAEDDYLDSVVLYLDEKEIVSWGPQGPFTYTLNLTELDEGPHRLVARAEDEAGNVAEDDLIIIVDNTAPDIAIISPEEESYLAGTQEVVVQVEDDNLVYAELYLSGLLSARWEEPGQYTIEWNTTLVPDGVYRLVLVAEDGAGNRAEVAITVIVDNTAPVAEILSPEPGSLLSGTVDVLVYYHDANLENASLYLDGTPLSLEGFKITLDTAKLPDGPHTLELVVRDRAGNEAVATVSFHTDNTVPEVAFTSPANGSTLSGVVEVSWQVSDANLAEVWLIIDGAYINVTGLTSYTWNTTLVQDGAHELVLVAVDEAGNEARAKIVVYTESQKKAEEAREAELREVAEETRNFYLTLTVPTALAAGLAVGLALRRRS